MKILRLTLKKKWFDMIRNGEKGEEYREIKPYWQKRFEKDYTHVEFINGYGDHRPRFTMELLTIKKGYGIAEHGAPNKPVFILMLGNMVP
jgi:quercetin dioxygenase-like cupin family protein